MIEIEDDLGYRKILIAIMGKDEHQIAPMYIYMIKFCCLDDIQRNV